MDKIAKIMTTKEVAAYLRCHPSTIYKLLRQNRLPAFKVGSDYRFDIDALDVWSSQQASPAQVPEPQIKQLGGAGRPRRGAARGRA